MKIVVTQSHLVFQSMLTESFARRDLGSFVYALEFSGADVNEQTDTGLTIFHNVLATPNADKFVRASICNGADLYSVRHLQFSQINGRVTFVI